MFLLAIEYFLAYLIAKEYDKPINTVTDVLKSNRPYMSNPGVYWDLVKEYYPKLHQYALDTSGTDGTGGFDMEDLQDKIIAAKYIYGPFGKIESYGRIEEYIKLNNGSNPFYIGKELIFYFSQGYAIRYRLMPFMKQNTFYEIYRKDYNYEKLVNTQIGRMRDMGLMQKFMVDSLDSRLTCEFIFYLDLTII